MNKNFWIYAFIFLSAFTALRGDEPDAMSNTATNQAGFQAVNRQIGDHTGLVIKDGKRDLFVVPHTPFAITPKLQATYRSGDQLALVVDNDFWLSYQLFKLERGKWSEQRSADFNNMHTYTRQRMILVEMPNLTTVKIYYPKHEDDIFRKKGVLQSGDKADLFDFSQAGKIKKNETDYDMESSDL